jgi:predicted enzyme involved in methoxymalonyl-ACP biosynthesis
MQTAELIAAVLNTPEAKKIAETKTVCHTIARALDLLIQRAKPGTGTAEEEELKLRWRQSSNAVFDAREAMRLTPQFIALMDAVPKKKEHHVMEDLFGKVGAHRIYIRPPAGE